jgi:hypothetical protein
MVATVDVIDWDEAMQQCGDDEEFLRKFLADLRSVRDFSLTLKQLSRYVIIHLVSL